jgi:hypothetical protein
MTIIFTGEATKLIRYGLAVALPGPGNGVRVADLKVKSELGTVGGGADHGDSSSYINHHMYDDDPRVAKNRQFPPKWTEKEFERTWRRISGPRLRRAS